MVGSADKIFNDIATGARDAWLTQVFGAGSVAAAKGKYAKGRTAMNSLHGLGRIVTDRSGYSEEVSLGGLTDPPGTPSQKIRVAKSVIDSPAANDSITTLLHESMHAGNADVSDDIYSTATGFTTQTAAQKLNNSAHYEVVPWRILEPTNPAAFAVVPATVPPTFQTFIPAGTTVAGVTAPSRTNPEKGAVAAYDLMREAWTIGLNLHPLYVQLFRTPTDWRVPQPAFGGRRFDRAIPFWSKVENLTIHKKTVIDPVSLDEAKHPVSQIDVALSEGVIRKLAFGMDVLDALHTDPQSVRSRARTPRHRNDRRRFRAARTTMSTPSATSCCASLSEVRQSHPSLDGRHVIFELFGSWAGSTGATYSFHEVQPASPIDAGQGRGGLGDA